MRNIETAFSPYLARWYNRLRYLRIQPFATDTEAGRAAERARRIALSAVASIANRLVSAATTLLTVPLTIGYLGAERYGLWLTVSSTLAMIGFADLGVGNGLRTRVAQADGQGDYKGIQSLVSSSFVMLCALSLLLSCGLALANPHIDWQHLLNLHTNSARSEVSSAVLVLGLITFVAMPFGVVSAVQNGLQASFISTVWTTIGTALSLVALIVATSFRVGLIGLIAAIAGVPVLITIANFVWYFGGPKRTLWPRFGLASAQQSVQLLRMGLLFVVLQLAMSFAFLSDNIVVARKLSAALVPELGVPAKLFSIGLLPVALITGPLWPAYGEALARGDVGWITRTIRRANRGSVLVAGAVGLVLVFVGAPLTKLWSHGVVSPRVTLLIAFAVWNLLLAWGQSTAAFLNGTGHVSEQAVCAILMAIVAFTLKWILVGWVGLSGVVWATVLAYALIVVVPFSLLVRRICRDAQRGTDVCPERTPGSVKRQGRAL